MTGSDAEKLATAIRLWMHWRQDVGSLYGQAGNQVVRIQAQVDAAEEAMRLAKAAGCHQEFLTSLSSMPVFVVEFRNAEEKPKRRGRKKCSVPDSGTSESPKTPPPTSDTASDSTPSA